jgi:GST-like protein
MMATTARRRNTVIEVYGGPTPNVFKVLIALEELRLHYRRMPLDITKGEQFTPEFLAISPNNRVPAIVDFDPIDGQGPLSVFESGAILVYLTERDSQHRLMPSDLRHRTTVMEWLMWQMAGQGPMLGQAGHFRNYAPEKVPYGIIRYTKESARLYGVLDKRLEGREWIAGDYSIADIACWPWIFFREQHGIELKDYPNVARWYEAFHARPTVVRAIGTDPAPKPLTLDEAALKLLFPLKDN